MEQKRIDEIQQEWVVSRVGGQTLHVGCGRKPIRLRGVMAAGNQVLNIDANPDKAQWADILLDVHDLSVFPDSSFDTVVSNHVLQALQNPIKALREMARVLCAGGRMAHVIPDARYIPEKMRNRPHHFYDHAYTSWFGPEAFRELVVVQLTDALQVITLENFIEFRWSFKFEAVKIVSPKE